MFSLIIEKRLGPNVKTSHNHVNPLAESEPAGECLSDKDLNFIALNIGDCWELLGIHLDIDRTQIERIKEDHGQSVARRYQMLQTWRLKVWRGATWSALQKALRESSGTGINWLNLKNRFG